MGFVVPALLDPSSYSAVWESLLCSTSSLRIFDTAYSDFKHLCLDLPSRSLEDIATDNPQKAQKRKAQSLKSHLKRTIQNL